MAPGRRRKVRISFLEILVILIAAAAVAAGFYLLADRGRSEARVAVMEEQLRDLRRLRTVGRNYRSVIYMEERSFWKGTKQVLFTLEYEVIAGVDFSRGVEIEELSDNVFRVRMPEAEVFSFDADEGSIRQMFLREQSFFNQVSMGDYMPQVVAQGEANRDAALKDGILITAQENARKAVVRVLELTGAQNVIFGPAISSAGSLSGRSGDDAPSEGDPNG